MATEEYTEGQETGGQNPWKMRRVLAASFLTVIVVAAAILLIVNRVGDDDSDTSAQEPVTADQYSWADKKADPWGTMMYLPEDRRGQILSEDTRDYADPSSDAAADARAEDVIFQATEFSGGAPIPFSSTDGPTGFDGVVPTGYTQSAAGATLAAAAYFTQMTMPPSYAEYIEKATIDPSTDDIAKAEDRVEENRAAHEEHDDIVGGAMRFYQVDAFDGDYAKIRLYLVSAAGGEDSVLESTADYRWVDGMWKISDQSGRRVLDTVPEEAESWPQ